MTFNQIDYKNLPSYVASRSEETKRKWITLHSATALKFGPTKALIVANTWLKGQIKKESFVKRSAVSFTLDSSRGFIKRDNEGNEYISFVLNSTAPHKDGKVFTPELLQSWADYINKNPTLVGDIDHKLYDEVVNSPYTNDEIQQILREKKGIAKALKAVYQRGKLWVRAIIDKRYRKLIEKAKGVSAEAFVTLDGAKVVAGQLLGFTFNVNTTPADNYAGVVA